MQHLTVFPFNRPAKTGLFYYGVGLFLFQHIFTHRIPMKLNCEILLSVGLLTLRRCILSSFRTSLEGSTSEDNFVCIPLALSWTPFTRFPFSASLPFLPQGQDGRKSEGPHWSFVECGAALGADSRLFASTKFTCFFVGYLEGQVVKSISFFLGLSFVFS